MVTGNLDALTLTHSSAFEQFKLQQSVSRFDDFLETLRAVLTIRDSSVRYHFWPYRSRR